MAISYKVSRGLMSGQEPSPQAHLLPLFSFLSDAILLHIPQTPLTHRYSPISPQTPQTSLTPQLPLSASTPSQLPHFIPTFFPRLRLPLHHPTDPLTLLGRPDLSLALTKLHLFRLSPLFSTILYLDADVLPLRPLSHLFESTNPHVLSACADTGWPDCFNSGVMVIRPRESDFEGMRGLMQAAIEGDGAGGLGGNGSFDGADQGLLNEWFSEEGGGGDWNRLSFT